MNCKKCGAILTENDQFCKSCGAAIETPNTMGQAGVTNTEVNNPVQQPMSSNMYQQPVQNFQQPMQQPMNNQQPVQQATNSNQFTQAFQDETLKKKEKMCEIGFWISIFGLLCSFLGVVMGLIVYALDFYFASQGLKTRKKGKAIATIVLSIISILVVVLQLIA